jgi:hypothetical protein
MKEIKVSRDNYRFSSKPDGSTIASISDRIGAQVKTYNQENVKSFVNMVGKEGCTFCPATFKNCTRSKENFEQLQLLALDFDSGITFENVKSRTEHYELPMLFAYDTLSSKSHDKFRVVFVNDVSIVEPKVAEAMQLALLTVFPEADQSCKDVSRMYFGGKGLLHFDNTVPDINIESLFRNTTICIQDRYGVTNYRKHLEKLSQTTGIALTSSNLLDISIVDNSTETTGVIQDNNISPESFTYIKDIGDNLLNQVYRVKFTDNSTSAYANQPQKELKNHSEYRSSTLKSIGTTCQLYHEFESGSKVLNHNELFGLATNLIQVETGTTLFNNILKEYSYYPNREYKYSKWSQDLKYMVKHNGYKPYACDKFCPYSSDCNHGTNMLSSAKVKYHQFERIANFQENYVSIEEASKDFKRKLAIAVDSEDKVWHVIKAQTALGKTESYLELLKNTTQKVLIAVPTLKLKREVHERAKVMGIEMIESPSLREYELPDDIQSHIDFLYKSGMSVTPYLKKMIKEDNPDCAAIFKKYLDDMDAFTKSSGIAITTHKRLLTLDTSNFDLVIVDEDIIFNTIIRNQIDIPISEIKKILKKISLNSPLAKKIRMVLKKSKTEEFFTLPKVDYNREAYDNKPTGIDLSSLCSAEYFCCHKESAKGNNIEKASIAFLQPIKFKQNVKYIMVSATVDEIICKYYFGENNVKFTECSKAKYVGTLNQYTDKSMSRASIGKEATIIEQIKKWSGFEHTITFMKYKLGSLHFGNTEGCDYLKGENIDVIGTPHQVEWLYKLFAYSLGFDVEAKLNPNAIITHNGYRFRFTTYDNVELRAIQFYIIESELEQAVGRARLLRYDCTVNLFSNFPLSQANLRESEYDRNGDNV